ncbi:MAG TPA: HAMP domain-containing sensor histidine kinase, partial [Cyanophyceae cyanobacterium]
LTTIQSSVELLEHYHNKLSLEKQLTHFNRISISVERMHHMLNEILLISEAEAGKLNFNPAPINLIKFCLTLVEELEQNGNNQNVVKEINPENRIIFTVEGKIVNADYRPFIDEKLLRQILTNLLSNALKYSDAGSTVQFDLKCLEDKVIFRIQDQGIGIPKADQIYLFDSFYRASNSGTIQGTGLGLAIVKQCVDLHHGEIAINSIEGVGTTFTVTLPLKCHSAP